MTKEKKPYSPTKIYNFLRKTSRKRNDELLALRESQFNGAISHFISVIVCYHIGIGRKNRNSDESLAMPRDGKPKDMTWHEITKDVVNELEILQLKMHFSTTHEIYESAEKRFEDIIKILKPKKRKEHTIKKDVLKFFAFFAERLITWSILTGEWKTLKLETNKQGRSKYNTDRGRLIVLKQYYSYRKEITHDDVKTSLNLYTATELAYLDVAKYYGLKSPNSVKNIISQW